MVIEYLKEPLAQQISNISTVSVGVSSVQVTAAANRQMIYIRNTSTAAQVITLVLSDTDEAVANNGIVLAAGEYFADSNSEGYKCWQGKISAISSAIGGSLTITQRPN